MWLEGRWSWSPSENRLCKLRLSLLESVYQIDLGAGIHVLSPHLNVVLMCNQKWWLHAAPKNSTEVIGLNSFILIMQLPDWYNNRFFEISRISQHPTYLLACAIIHRLMKWTPDNYNLYFRDHLLRSISIPSITSSGHKPVESIEEFIVNHWKWFSNL